MKILKKIIFWLIAVPVIVMAGGVVYMYVSFCYVENKLKTITPLAPVKNTVTYGGKIPSQLVIHQVNTPLRAKLKQKTYGGFELDLFVDKNGEMFVAHDEGKLYKKVKIEDIFAALDNPSEQLIWFDLKSPLSQAHIDYIKKTATEYHIPHANLFFEFYTENLLTIRDNGLQILYQIIDSFDKDNGDPALREKINTELAEELEKYKPMLITASVGKYPYLRAYFPDAYFAIHYSTTKRPSLKKVFIMRKLLRDPNVKFIMMDEYTLSPI